MAYIVNGQKVHEGCLPTNGHDLNNLQTFPLVVIDSYFCGVELNGTIAKFPYREALVRDGKSALIIEVMKLDDNSCTYFPVSGLERVMSLASDLGIEPSNISDAKGTRLIGHIKHNKIYGISILYH